METLGTAQLLSIIQGGYGGRIYPIHPREKKVLGLRSYPDVRLLPETPDLVIMAISGHRVPGLLDACGRKGIRRAVVVSAGFGEMGAEGRQLEDALLEVARTHGIRFLGPNCIGFLNTALSLNTTWFPFEDRPGRIGLISQSGTYVTQMLEYFRGSGIRLSQAISVGNQGDLDMVEGLRYLGQDTQTKAIALYIEGLKDPRAFLTACKTITPHKPVVALFVGGTESGARAGRSHTGALASPGHLYEGLFRQCGVLRTYSVGELFDAALALAEQPLPKGDRVVVLTNSGGPGTCMANECERNGLKVPVLTPDKQEKIATMTPSTASVLNPIDITMNYDFELIYRRIPEVLLDGDDYDAMLFYGLIGPDHFLQKAHMAREICGSGDLSFFQKMEGLLRTACRTFGRYPEKFGKPILCNSFFSNRDLAVQLMRKEDVPVYPSPERASRALVHLFRYKQILDRLQPAEAGRKSFIAD